MRIAALYDIHGNLPALEAVLKELEDVRPDLIVIGGDIVSGPMPGPTLERLRHLGSQVRALRGNGDREVVMAYDDLPLPPRMSEGARVITRWVAHQLDRAERDYLAELPERVPLHIEGIGDVLFCHATPRSDEEIFTPLTSQERLTTLFTGVEQQLVVCGHTHMQFERSAGPVHIVNAGSVGMPYADSPGAYWLLLGPEGYEFRRTAYDVEAAAQQVRNSGYPQAEEFADENVLTVHSAAAVAEFFEGLVR